MNIRFLCQHLLLQIGKDNFCPPGMWMCSLCGPARGVHTGSRKYTILDGTLLDVSLGMKIPNLHFTQVSRQHKPVSACKQVAKTLTDEEVIIAQRYTEKHFLVSQIRLSKSNITIVKKEFSLHKRWEACRSVESRWQVSLVRSHTSVLLGLLLQVPICV